MPSPSLNGQVSPSQPYTPVRASTLTHPSAQLSLHLANKPPFPTGMTIQDSLSIPTITAHAQPKTLAKQWLSLYQRGPLWVIPSILTSTLSNAYLAWLCPSPTTNPPFPTQRNLYALSALIAWSILPITFLYFEPGINGACKWKIQSLLGSEGYVMPPFNGIPSSVRHSATPAARAWAQGLSMRELVEMWGWRNHGRWVVSLVGAVVSGWATLGF